jgi:hypothetical protein
MDHGDEDHHDEQFDGDGDPQTTMGYTSHILVNTVLYFVLLSHVMMFLSTCAW